MVFIWTEKLCSEIFNEKEYVCHAEQIINQDNLPFGTFELIDILKKIRNGIWHIICTESWWNYSKGVQPVIPFLLNKSRDTNKDLYLAILYAIKDNYSVPNLTILVGVSELTQYSLQSKHLIVGVGNCYPCLIKSDERFMCEVICHLQNYNAFDFIDFGLSDESKEIINAYITNNKL